MIHNRLKRMMNKTKNIHILMTFEHFYYLFNHKVFYLWLRFHLSRARINITANDNTLPTRHLFVSSSSIIIIQKKGIAERVTKPSTVYTNSKQLSYYSQIEDKGEASLSKYKSFVAFDTDPNITTRDIETMLILVTANILAIKSTNTLSTIITSNSYIEKLEHTFLIKN